MSIVTVTKAIRLSGKSSATFYRHLKQGKVSRASDGSGGIDTSELVRVYGELKDMPQRVTTTPPVENHETNKENDWLRKQVEQLQRDLKDLKTESLERERRLMALLEHKKEQGEGFFGKLFK